MPGDGSKGQEIPTAGTYYPFFLFYILLREYYYKIKKKDKCLLQEMSCERSDSLGIDRDSERACLMTLTIKPENPSTGHIK